MNTENVTPVSGELTSPRFDTVATNRAHPVVPLSSSSESGQGRGVIAAIRGARPAVLVVGAILLAAVIVAAGTAIYRQQQPLVSGSVQGLDDTVEASPAEAASEKQIDTAPARRRANVRSATPSMPIQRAPEAADRAAVLATIQQIIQQRSRSRGERDEKHDRRGKRDDKDGGKDKRGRGKDRDDH